MVRTHQNVFKVHFLFTSLKKHMPTDHTYILHLEEGEIKETGDIPKYKKARSNLYKINGNLRLYSTRRYPCFAMAIK